MIIKLMFHDNTAEEWMAALGAEYQRERKHLILTIDTPTGVQRVLVGKDATVVIYSMSGMVLDEYAVVGAGPKNEVPA